MLGDGVADAHPAVTRRQQPSITTITTTPAIVPSDPTASITTRPSTTTVPRQSLVLSTISDGDPEVDNLCTVALPSGGVIRWNDTDSQTLIDAFSFEARCDDPVFHPIDQGNSTVVPDGDHFYASLAPQVYALATATIISYVLVIILFITPRTFFVGGPGGSRSTSTGRSGFLSRGMTLVGTGSRNPGAVGVGQRPLLQKIATITVAVSLTIATSDTFQEAEKQYNAGYIDASVLVREVVQGNEIKITRIVSDTFLWLAQVQTLIRLFPRHKEKVTIKWLGFGLVTCDTVFSIIENFVSDSVRSVPRPFTDAFPALSYLFELAIALIYASCVVYYALSKRRFAFWHAKMRNVGIVALISLTAVLIPVVFFIVDIAQPDIATWGEYIRWVGAAAASVVVWEWVERIEALERDEKKDGILGREVYDGDEMLDMTTSEDMNMDAGGAGVHFGSGDKQATAQKTRFTWKNIRDLSFHPQVKLPDRKNKRNKKKEEQQGKSSRRQSLANPLGLDASNGITRPPQAATPISRSDTTSAASTVYAVRYHNPLSPSPAIPEGIAVTNEPKELEVLKEMSDDTTLTNTTTTTHAGDDSVHSNPYNESSRAFSSGRQIWQSVANPFKRKRAEPPAEVAAQIVDSNMRRSPADRPLNLRGRFNTFASQQKERFGGRVKTRTPLQVTVIPAQPRELRGQARDDGTVGNESILVPQQESQGLAPAIHITGAGSGNTSGNNTPRRASLLPVTVIPAPVRGGRTWSPDDMNNAASPGQNEGRSDSSSSESTTRSQNFSASPESASHVQPSQRQSANVRVSPPVPPQQSQTASSPGRTTNSPGAARPMLKTPDFARNRAATGTSMSERMGEPPGTRLTNQNSQSPTENVRQANSGGGENSSTSPMEQSSTSSVSFAPAPSSSTKQQQQQQTGFGRVDTHRRPDPSSANEGENEERINQAATNTMASSAPAYIPEQHRPQDTGSPPTPRASGPGRPANSEGT